MLQVRDTMTTDVLTLAPDTSVREALEALRKRHDVSEVMTRAPFATVENGR